MSQGSVLRVIGFRAIGMGVQLCVAGGLGGQEICCA